MGEKLFVLLGQISWVAYYESELPQWAQDAFKEFIESDAPIGEVAKSGKTTFLVRIGPDSAREAGLKR